MAIDRADLASTADDMTDLTGMGLKLVRRFVRNRMATAGMIILLFILVVAIFAPWIAPFDPQAQNLRRRFETPSPDHWFGTDELGRDIFSRIVYGSRVSLMVGFAAAFGGLVVGVVIGMLSGYYGGRFDDLVMRLIDVMMSFPGILLAILIVSVIGTGTLNVIIALAVWRIPTFARISRGSVLSLKEKEFVEAARAVGANMPRIVFRHLAINSLPPIFVYLSLSTATAILTAAALSFLGLGVQPPTAEWGLMVSTGRQFLRQAPHLIMIPGLAVFVTVLSINFVGDALRDVLDPRLKM
ncbi:MAG: ABC transporter permease [Bacillota bacterium]